MHAHQGRRRPPPAFPRPQQPHLLHDAPALSQVEGRARAWRVPEEEEPAPAAIEIEGEATTVPEPPNGQATIDEAPAAILNQYDDLITAGLDACRLSVAAGETGMVRVALLNNGDRHACFHIHVEGWVDEGWVRILRSDQEEAGAPTLRLWLHPAERALLTVAITPPHTPASIAGERPFAVIIRTADYGERQCRLGALLTVQPYHSLLLGAVAPRRPFTGWRRRTVNLVLPVTNQGNTAAELFVQGHDARRQCRITFLAPGSRRWQPRRATFTLAPGKTAQLRLRVTPPPPPVIGLRTRTAQVGLAVGYQNAANTPLSARATVMIQPMIGPWLLATLCGLCGLVVIGAFLLAAVAATLVTRGAPGSGAPRVQPTPPSTAGHHHCRPSGTASGSLGGPGSCPRYRGQRGRRSAAVPCD